MTLSEVAQLCSGLKLYFTPKFGWGWKAPAEYLALSFGAIERSGPIELDVLAAFRWQDNLRGLYGVIAGDGHILRSYNFVMWSMGAGVIDPDKGEPNHRWDLFFSRQPFREDLVDFPDQDAVGIGYGTPSLAAPITRRAFASGASIRERKLQERSTICRHLV